MKNHTTITRLDHSAFATMFMYASGANALPICLVMMSRELGFNLTQAGLLGFIPSFVQFFVLILSCFAAARFGKIRVLKTALIIMALGLLAFSSTSSYTSTVALMLMIGVGYAFLEALLTPLVEDMHPGDSGSRMNLLHAFWPIGVLMSVLIVGELLSRGVSWRLVFVGLSLATLVVLFSYPSSKHVNLPGSRTDFSHMGDILSRRRFWFLGASLFFAGGAEVSFAFWSASYIQLHFKTLPRAGALGAAIFALGMVIGRMASTRILRRVKIKHLVLVSAALALTGSLCFFLIDSLAALYGLLLFMGLSIACHWPSIQTYAARVMPVDSTVLMIFLSCFGIPGASVAPLLMGALGDRYGLKAAFIVAPIFLSLLVVSLLLEGKPCKDGHFPSIVSPGATV